MLFFSLVNDRRIVPRTSKPSVFSIESFRTIHLEVYHIFGQVSFQTFTFYSLRYRKKIVDIILDNATSTRIDVNRLGWRIIR